jgi:hypothetical protein
MSAELALGRLFNLGVSITTAKSRFNMRDCDTIGVLMVGASAVSNLTLNECNAASGGTEQALAVVTQYWTQAAAATPTAWTRVAVAGAAVSAVPSINGGLTYFEVSGVSMSDGFKYIDVTHATATMIMIPAGLDVRRAPESLVSAVL